MSGSDNSRGGREGQQASKTVARTRSRKPVSPRVRVRGRIGNQLHLYPILFASDLELTAASTWVRYRLHVEHSDSGRPMRAVLVPENGGPEYMLDAAHLDWCEDYRDRVARLWWWVDHIERENIARDAALDEGGTR